jgi:peptide/nickel transport system substrate-binding protein
MKHKKYLAGVAAAGVLGAVAIWLTGPSPSPPKDTIIASPRRTAQASVLRGGTLKIATDRTIHSWDPATASDPFMDNVRRLYLRTLMAHPQGRNVEGHGLVPDLASAPPAVSPDATAYTFTLREGVKFEDGTPVTAADVKHGIERSLSQGVPSGLVELLDPNGTLAQAREDGKTATLPSIEVPGPDTIIFRLAGPSAEFSQLLAAPATAPVPRGKSESGYGSRPVATGPYRFAEEASGRRLALVRNPHWNPGTDPARRALPDEVELTLGVSPGRFQELLDRDQGQDIVLITDPAQAGTLRGAAPLGSVSDLYDRTTTYVALTGSAPFDDLDCRRAVLLAAADPALRAAVQAATGGSTAPNLLPPGVEGADPSWDPYGLAGEGGKTADATAHLANCADGKGFSTSLAVRGDRPADLTTAEALKAALGRVGITVQIVPLADDAAWQAATGTADDLRRNGYGLVMGRTPRSARLSTWHAARAAGWRARTCTSRSTSTSCSVPAISPWPSAEAPCTSALASATPFPTSRSACPTCRAWV